MIFFSSPTVCEALDVICPSLSVSRCLPIYVSASFPPPPPPCLNPFQTKLLFLRVYGTSLWQILWEKEKLLVPSNSSFSVSVFLYLFIYLFIYLTFLPFSSNFKLSSANSFSLGEPEICRLGKG